MLGCKSRCWYSYVLHDIELIDTCWDVNNNRLTDSDYDDYELIDTCWDVNSVCISQAALESGELIDTCWDVNAYHILLKFRQSGN